LHANCLELTNRIDREL